MNFRKCQTCGQYTWQPDHRCPPLWLVSSEHDPEHWERIRAKTAHEAAEKRADQIDAEDFPHVAEGSPLMVRVRAGYGDPSVQVFRVTGEFVRQYQAKLVDGQTVVSYGGDDV